MSIVENSFFGGFLLALWSALASAWSESTLNRLFNALAAWAARLAKGSLLCRLVSREGALDRAWPRSVTCQLLTALANLPCALIKLLYRALRPLWEGSFFARLLTALGGAAAPILGLLMLVMLCAPHDYWNNVYGFLGAAAVCALYILGVGGTRRRIELERLGPRLIFFFGFVCVAFATSWSTSLSLRFFLFHVTCLLVVLILVSSVQTFEQLQTTVAVALLGVLVASLYGCYQGVVGVPVVANQQDPILNAGMPGRVYSLFDNPNNFAEVLVMFLPLALALLLTARTWRGRIGALAVLGSGVAAIGYTLSRSGWLGLMLAVFVFLALLEWRVVPFAVLGALALFPFLPETVVRRFLTIGNRRDTSTLYRFAIYGATGDLLKDYWFQGVGLGSDVMRKVFAQYPAMYDGNHPIHTHNNYLQMWVELGLAGGLAYLGVVLGQVKSGIKALYAAQNRRVRILLAGAVGAFCGILLIGVAEYTWFYPRNMFFFWFLFAVISTCVKLVGKEKA